MTTKMLFLLGTFINKTHLSSKLLNEVLMLKVLITWKKLLKVVDKTVMYQLPECVLSKVLTISLIKIIQKNCEISLERRNIDQE